jgi:5-formyltetrahydrofolate cyclo-ligase
VSDVPVDDRDRVPELKASLRRLMRDVRRTVPAVERARQGRVVADRLVGLLADLPDDAIVLSYQSIDGELPTDAINSRLAERFQVAVPRVTPGGIEAVIAATQWAQRAFGILEPVDGRVVAAGELAAVVVPGVAFTADGRRLGQGGGYYDRLLPTTNGRSIGVCLAEQIVDAIPILDHDVSVADIVAGP